MQWLLQDPLCHATKQFRKPAPFVSKRGCGGWGVGRRLSPRSARARVLESRARAHEAESSAAERRGEHSTGRLRLQEQSAVDRNERWDLRSRRARADGLRQGVPPRPALPELEAKRGRKASAGPRASKHSALATQRCAAPCLSPAQGPAASMTTLAI